MGMRGPAFQHLQQLEHFTDMSTSGDHKWQKQNQQHSLYRKPAQTRGVCEKQESSHVLFPGNTWASASFSQSDTFPAPIGHLPRLVAAPIRHQQLLICHAKAAGIFKAPKDCQQLRGLKVVDNWPSPGEELGGSCTSPIFGPIFCPQPHHWPHRKPHKSAGYKLARTGHC